MSEVLIAIDVVGSTTVKQIYGEAHGIKLISAALQLIEISLRRADPELRHASLSAGDNSLLIGGTNALALYKAAVVHQSEFISWCYGRIPIKIVIGYGSFESVTDHSGRVHERGRDLDFMFRVCDVCPAAGVCVTPPMFALLNDGGFGARLIKRIEDLDGFGMSVFYESDGDYMIPVDQRQRMPHKNLVVVSPVSIPAPPIIKPINEVFYDRVRLMLPIAIIIIIVLLIYNAIQLTE